MRELIRQYALELGFDVCRFTSAAPPESAPRFRGWLADGQNGEMAYLQRNAEKRVDPQRVLPGAATIVTLAISYATARSCECMIPGQASAQLEGPDSKLDSERSQRQNRPAGIVARYARFTDYHHVLGDRLKDLVKYMTRIGGKGTRSLWYVDTGPFLERDIAQRGGLGFVGKHTNLINRRLGNWFFIAEVITTLRLKEDLSEKNRCGSCTRCITACPTAAITSPFRFAGTPILRTRRRGLLRNVCVALGNVGAVVALPALEQAAHEPDPLIAEHARWAAEQIERRTEETSSAS